jgi:hypothetical protein
MALASYKGHSAALSVYLRQMGRRSPPRPSPASLMALKINALLSESMLISVYSDPLFLFDRWRTKSEYVERDGQTKRVRRNWILV